MSGFDVARRVAGQSGDLVLSLICANPNRLSAPGVGDLATSHFVGNVEQREIWTAIRCLQAEDSPINLDTIIGYVRDRDIERGDTAPGTGMWRRCMDRLMRDRSRHSDVEADRLLELHARKLLAYAPEPLEPLDDDAPHAADGPAPPEVLYVDPGYEIPTPAPGPRWHRASDLVELILKYADEPLVPLKLGGDELEMIRAGGTAVVMGPTGSGKSSLVAGLLIAHDGPTVVLSRELPADELAARAIGMQCDAN